MINKWWNELNNKYRNIELYEYITMPNHFHGIIQIVDLVKTVVINKTGNIGEYNSGEHAGSPLHAMIQWFKTMTTNEYIRNVKQNGWHPFNKKLWQRNYYEHIIRDEKSYQRIAEYIVNNSVNWQIDKYNEQNNSSQF
ncbi:MAG: transposase [Smithellaceae bacterium]